MTLGEDVPIQCRGGRILKRKRILDGVGLVTSLILWQKKVFGKPFGQVLIAFAGPSSWKTS
jgi:hypothetical protein